MSPLYLETSGADALLPHISRMRAIREQYAGLEIEKYGQPWGFAELSDGARGDIGDASKLETGRRGLRDNYTPEAMEHEIADIAWSFVVLADKTLTDPTAACQAAAAGPPVAATSRQLINRLALIHASIDEIVDPPEEPLAPVVPAEREGLLYVQFVEGFRTVATLAAVNGVDLSLAITRTMDVLEARIQAAPGQGQ